MTHTFISHHHQLYYLLLPHRNFDGIVGGEGKLYRKFWENRYAELQALSPQEDQALTDHLNEQVLGLVVEEDGEEEERQNAFHEAKMKELKGRAGGSKDGEKQRKSEEMDRVENQK